MTQVRCSLDEWKDGHRRTVSFSASVYRRVYQELLHTIAILKADSYHGEKFTKACCDWALIGRCVSVVLGLVLLYGAHCHCFDRLQNEPQGPMESASSFVLHLD